MIGNVTQRIETRLGGAHASRNRRNARATIKRRTGSGGVHAIIKLIIRRRGYVHHHSRRRGLRELTRRRRIPTETIIIHTVVKPRPLDAQLCVQQHHSRIHGINQRSNIRTRRPEPRVHHRQLGAHRLALHPRVDRRDSFVILFPLRLPHHRPSHVSEHSADRAVRRRRRTDVTHVRVL